MTTLRKQAKEKSCWVCGEQRRRLFSMGKVLEQTSEREMVFTIKKEWLCLPCFERRYFETNDHAKVCEAEKLEQELAAKDKEIEALKVNNRDLAAIRFELMNRVSELELCLRDVVTNSKDCTQCSASFIAERKLEGK